MTRGNDFTVMISVLVKNRGHCISKVFDGINALNYPKKNVIVYVNIGQSKDDTKTIVNDYSFEGYKDVIIKENDINTSDTQELMLTTARKKEVDYLFVVDSDIVLENKDTLQQLINQNRSIIAPMVTKKKIPFWSNFWGDVDDNFFYKRISEPYFNYFDIVNREKIGVWNVPVVHSCYLIDINGKHVDRLSYKGKYKEGYRDLARNCVDRFVFMNVLNDEYYGYIVDK